MRALIEKFFKDLVEPTAEELQQLRDLYCGAGAAVARQRIDGGGKMEKPRTDAATRVLSAALRAPQKLGYWFGRQMLGDGDKSTDKGHTGLPLHTIVLMNRALTSPAFVAYPLKAAAEADERAKAWEQELAALLKTARQIEATIEAYVAAESRNASAKERKTLEAAVQRRAYRLFSQYQALRVMQLVTLTSNEPTVPMLEELFAQGELAPAFLGMLGACLRPFLATSLNGCELGDIALARLAANLLAGLVAGASSDGTSAKKGNRTLGRVEGACYASAICIVLHNGKQSVFEDDDGIPDFPSFANHRPPHLPPSRFAARPGPRRCGGFRPLHSPT